MSQITLYITGDRQELTNLQFAIFEHVVQFGVPKDVPDANATITLEQPLVKHQGPGLMEIIVNFGENFAASALANYLFSKWEKAGKPRTVIIKIENRMYQFDAGVLTRALEALVGALAKKGPAKVAAANTALGGRQSPSGPKDRKKVRS